MADGTPDVEDLWNRYAPLVLRRCRQLLRDEDEALDVCQDVFVQLLRRRDDLDIRFPSSLVYRMATNLCLNRIRDRRHWPDLVEDETLARIARLDDPTAERKVVLRLLSGEPAEIAAALEAAGFAVAAPVPVHLGALAT